MYEQHFGLQKSPFTARAAGADVFVGPQTATTMAGLKKALQSQDAVIAVWGRAGTGKSTLVGKALDAIADTHRQVRIGRMSLDGADALEFLLEELGVAELPRGTIRQFTALREKLGQLESEGKRLVIVVEDAVRTGVETMAELEALTAADAGRSGGAAIVVMGDDRLGDFLRDGQLARLAQRIRLRQEIAPLSPAELRGYLVHCFRKAGKEFENIFESDAAVVVHDLSGGTPRVANTLVDAVLAAAAASELAPVNGTFIAEVGANQLGLVASGNCAAAPAPDKAPEPATEAAPEPATEAAPEPPTEPAPESAPEPAGQPEPIIVFSDEPAEDLPGDGEIPELIQDTLPDLEVLMPEFGEAEADAAPEPESEPEPEPKPEAEPEPEPPLAAAAAKPTPAPAPADVPDWERDPTMAELRPDLEALEKAMAFAHGEDEAGEPPVLEPLAEPVPEPESAVAEIEEIPEITLDHAIQERVENSLIDEPGAISAGAESPPSMKSGDLPEVRLPGKNAKKADQELERIAAELARAKTIEDVDDKLAETLFGEEFNLVAAQVVANGPGNESANDEELSLFDTGAAEMAQATGTPVTEDMSFDEPDGAASPETHRVSEPEAPMAAPEPDSDPDPDTSVREIATPQPIEDQINTSMTQTLKALNVRPPVSNFDDDALDDEDEKKGGFFSRFRRS